jgi:hypothetical protein
MADPHATGSRAANEHAFLKSYWKRYKCKGCGDINPPTINCAGMRGISVEVTSEQSFEPPRGEGWMPARPSDVEPLRIRGDDFGA